MPWVAGGRATVRVPGKCTFFCTRLRQPMAVFSYALPASVRDILEGQMGTPGPLAVVTAYQLRVTLRDISPLVWHRLLVRSDTTIAQLHAVLQIAMGWEDVHLQQFRIHGKAYGVYREDGMTFADNSHTVRLAHFRLRRGERFVYEYDMGDFWQHDIRLEQVLPLDARTRYPVCTAGSGDCPPEGCGGPSGYAAFLLERGSRSAIAEVYEALAVVAERVREWLDDRPTAFSRHQVNTALRGKLEELPCTSVSM